MPIDPNIALQFQPIQLQNPLDAATKALSLRDLSQRSQIQNMQMQQQQQSMGDQQALRSSLVKNTTLGADGSPQINHAGVMSDLSKVNPQAAMDYDKKVRGDNLDELTKQSSISKDLIWRVPTDAAVPIAEKQAAWDQMRQAGIQAKLPNADKVPEQYPGDNFVKLKQHDALTAEEQLKQQNSERDFNLKSQENQEKHTENKIKQAQLDVDKNDKLAGKFQDHLDKGWTARSGAAGTVQGKIVAAEAAQQLIEQGKTQAGGLDSRQIEELAQSTGRLLGGGAAASARIDALVPHTLMGRAQTLKEYLSNSPSGANAQEFVQRMAETVEREKALAENQKRQFQIEGLPRFAALKKKDPDTYNAILKGKGIDPSTMIDQNGRYKAPSAAGQSFDHLSDDQVDALYKQNGGK